MNGLTGVRIGVFLCALVVFSVLERLYPRRQTTRPRDRIANLCLAPVGSLAVRLLVPAGLVVFAAGWTGGLFPWLGVPRLPAVLAGILILDLAIYLQHRLFHRVPWLWRLHRVHHTDLDLDATSGVRFHPGEIALSAFVKLAVIALLGLPALAVLVFELLLNATSLFNHSNLDLGPAADRRLRRVVVTPAMHEIHHSAWPGELDRNFGFNFPWWDHWFRTYLERSEAPSEVPIGLPMQGRRRLGFWAMMIEPLRTRAAGGFAPPRVEGPLP